MIRKIRLRLVGLWFCLGLAHCLSFAWAIAVHGADQGNWIFISEFLADNTRGLKDDEGNFSGWLELHQTSLAPLDLGGWFLTDSRTNLTKWRFPRVTLLPGKYMVIFASGKDRTTNRAYLHTNFRLNPAGGYLALVDRATNVVSEFAPSYPKQAADVSFGSVVGEPAVRGQFLRSTPGRVNSSSGPGFAPAVVFSQAGGTSRTHFDWN